MNDTDLDLDAIEARATAARSGPWYRDPTREEDEVDAVMGPLVQTGNLIRQSMICEDIDRHADADFIAQARTDIPALIAEVRRLRSLVGAS